MQNASSAVDVKPHHPKLEHNENHLPFDLALYIVHCIGMTFHLLWPTT